MEPFDVEAPPPVSYGPGIPDESSLRLLGHVEGRRILVLGCGDGRNVVALAAAGARPVAVEPSSQRLDRVRERCEEAGLRAELHHGDLAELAFLRADTVDAALSVHALADADDPDRVFRQVHRVLSPETPLVVALPHPATADPSARPIGESFTSLLRANFRVDSLLELGPSGPTSPTILVLRGKKEGS
jgi:ubiquinone/menaquinone biosynthesis C-methylase UbiE